MYIQYLLSSVSNPFNIQFTNGKRKKETSADKKEDGADNPITNKYTWSSGLALPIRCSTLTHTEVLIRDVIFRVGTTGSK